LLSPFFPTPHANLLLSIDPQLVVTTRPPAKLNFFLELLRRRDDGYHDIDTVMAAIDWCDRLSVRRTVEPGIRLHCDWSPSRAAIAGRSAVDINDAALLDIPTGESNLVQRALSEFVQTFSIGGGLECWLEKQIPAGAGMGGASSDAASSLLCAAALCQIDAASPKIYEIASRIGSDVPFFLGSACQPSQPSSSHPSSSHPSSSQRVSQSDAPQSPYFAARAQGRGTEIRTAAIGFHPHLVVAFPGVCLSTAKVYGECQVPEFPTPADAFLQAWKNGNQHKFLSLGLNRLAKPARKLSHQIDEILESMWRCGARTCQLTGSGSACFAIVGSAREARKMAKRLQATRYLQATNSGTRVLARTTMLTRVPAQLEYRHI
jgi:4-diphosphocytidyl-2-C-methyl-D-erythritol kinase